MKRMVMAGWMAAVGLAMGAGVMSAQATQWKIDPMHSEADFAIKHMSISTVHGTFRGISGTITYDPANVAKSGVEASIDVTSVDTGVAPRDKHLNGVTKPVVLKLEDPGKAETGMDGKSVHRGFTATTTINRKDFGLTWNGTLKSGDAVLGDDVRIELDIEGSQI